MYVFSGSSNPAGTGPCMVVIAGEYSSIEEVTRLYIDLGMHFTNALLQRVKL
jgi:hypothetical protein